jgi:hypothetical protein
MDMKIWFTRQCSIFCTLISREAYDLCKTQQRKTLIQREAIRADPHYPTVLRGKIQLMIRERLRQSTILRIFVRPSGSQVRGISIVLNNEHNVWN